MAPDPIVNVRYRELAKTPGKTMYWLSVSEFDDTSGFAGGRDRAKKKLGTCTIYYASYWGLPIGIVPTVRIVPAEPWQNVERALSRRSACVNGCDGLYQRVTVGQGHLMHHGALAPVIPIRP